MENKIGIFIALLGFVALIITSLSKAPQIAKSFLIIFFLFIICLGVLLETNLGNFLRERVEKDKF